jgi:anti-sigma regulatory factor (Ser/Thr protein kinase)
MFGIVSERVKTLERLEARCSRAHPARGRPSGATVSFRLLIERFGGAATMLSGLRLRPRRRPWSVPVETGRAAEDRLELSVPTDPYVLQHVRQALRGLAHNLALDQERAESLLVAVGEALSNSMEHAYPGSRGTVFLRARRDGPSLLVEIEDRGRWRRPSAARRQGYGLELMRALMDGVTVDTTENGTTVRLALSLPPNVS